jgi:predicted RNA-binding protein
MCLTTVYIDSGDEAKEVMHDVAQMEARKDGFLLTGLLGEEKFIKGKVKRIDFVSEHEVVLEKT